MNKKKPVGRPPVADKMVAVWATVRQSVLDKHGEPKIKALMKKAVSKLK